MSVEPPTKKLKLELSRSNEPLTRNDIILFQKDALFRCISQYRTDLEVLTTQYDLTRKQCKDITTKLANLMALIVTLANFLEKIVEDGEEKSICRNVSEGDEVMIIQLSDSFMKLLTKYSGKEISNEAEKAMSLSVELKNLQRSKDELMIENKHLVEQIDSIKSFYQKELRKYNREDSPTIRRAFKKDTVKNEALDSSVKNEFADEKINGDAAGSNSNESESSNGVVKRENQTNNDLSAKNDKSQTLQNDIEVSNLKSKIDILNSTIEDLQKHKIEIEKELVTLRTKNAQLTSNSPVNNHDEELLMKVRYLTEENHKLTQKENEYMNMYQELNRSKEIYAGKLTKEFETAQETLKKHNAYLEKDLVRIRATRDDLSAKVALLEAKTSKSEIITDLQTILEVLKEQWKLIEERSNKTQEADVVKDPIMKELQDLELAFKNVSNLVNKKYSEYLNSESVMTKLTVEKTKADQKYFAAMRSKDSILIENKNLSKSLAKSNELIAQLKDGERLFQQKIENLHKQLDLSQSNEKRSIDANKTEVLKTISVNSELSKFKKVALQLEEQNSKNLNLLSISQSQSQALESEKKALKLKVNHLESQNEKLQKTLFSEGGDTSALAEELENFRNLVYCSLCSKNWKSTAIKTCGHVFCDNCCQGRLVSRMRKCPTCNKPFSSNDLLSVHL